MIIADRTITVISTIDDQEVKVQMKIYAVTRVATDESGEIIDVTVTCDVPYRPKQRRDHPLAYVCSHDYPYDKCYSFDTSVNDTPAIRALIEELANPNEYNDLYHRSDCTHRSSLLKAIDTFWV